MVRPARPARPVEARDGAAATSGSKHRGARLLDPHTRRPATAVRSVTVTGPELLWADVFATAAAARGAGTLPWIETQPGYEAMIVLRSGLIRTSSGWRR